MPADLLNRLRLRGAAALHAVPYGGLEIGGVLFGRVHPNARTPIRLELAAERPIECSHSDGPAFSLSEEDQQKIAELLDRARIDPELSALSVMGFWVSHSRGGLGLSPADLNLYKRFFHHSWQIVLVMKPASGEPTAATFFFRNSGIVSAHHFAHEFYAEPHLEGVRSLEPAAPELSPVAEETRQPPSGASGSRPGARLNAPLWTQFLALGVAAAILGAGSMYYLRDFVSPAARAPNRSPELTLEVFPAGEELLIHWNAKSPEVRNAKSAELIIHDGPGTQASQLDSNSLSKGYLRFKPKTGEVEVALRLANRDGSVEQEKAFWVRGSTQ